MRPDCSLLHFRDACGWRPRKMDAFRTRSIRVNTHRGNVPDPGGSRTLQRFETRPVSADLLKMHAYRDAIRRTSGAYVLYPGGDEAPTRHAQYHEVLPGLGAFVLRPGESMAKPAADSALGLRRFIEDALPITWSCAGRMKKDLGSGTILCIGNVTGIESTDLTGRRYRRLTSGFSSPSLVGRTTGLGSNQPLSTT